MPFAMFVGLNPSTADETNDDRTVRKCIKYAETWGFGGLSMANLFAIKGADPSVILGPVDPVGPENDLWLTKLSRTAGIVVIAWGNYGSYQGRGKVVMRLLTRPHYLKLNKSGEPSHPLYLDASLKPHPYQLV